MAEINNYKSNKKLSGTNGDDKIWNGADNVTIDGGSDNDQIYSYGASVSINGNSGNDTIYSDIGGSDESGSSITITGGSGDDFIDSDSPFSIIDGSTGNDDIVNYGWETSINGGEGNDIITNYNLFHIEGSKVTINGGKGNDIINIENAENNLIQYFNGDGNDKIYGFNETSTLSIGGSSYSTKKSGDNVIVTVGTGKISLIGAANLSKVNIKGSIESVKSNNVSIPADTFEYNGHSYYIYSNVADTWDEAKSYCEARGGHLAVINDEAENNAVFDYMKSKGYDSAYFGLSDAAKEGTWTWVNGDSSTYRNWASGEPNNEGGNENYGMFYWKFSDGTWNDGNVQKDSAPFICEWETTSKTDKNEKKPLLGAVGELMEQISDSEFTDLIDKLTKIASEWLNISEAGLINSTIDYLKKVREVFKNPSSDLSGQAKLWELSGASVKEFADFYDVISNHTNATNPALWGDAAERNVKVLTMAADILSVKASFVAAKAELKKENLLAAITNYTDAFIGFGDFASDSYELISKNKNPWNVAEIVIALYKGAVSILGQSTKSHQRYYADGKWDLNDTARFLLDVSVAGIYGTTHHLNKEADDLIYDWIIGDDFADSDLTTSEKLSAKLNNLGNNIGAAIAKFGLNVGKALGNMWNQLNSLGYSIGQNIATVGLNIGNAIGNLLKGAFDKEVVYLNANGEVISSSKDAVASITMGKTKFTCKALKNTAQNLSLGSKNDTSDWEITTNSGNDKIICASNKKVTIKSGDGDDTISGGTGSDKLYGQNGNDSLVGGAGNDSMSGGAGADKLYGNAGDDYIQGNDGNDSISGGAGNDKVYGNAGDDYIQGNDGKDSISGGAGNDKVYGNAGDDYIQGNTGDDSILGGDGNDSIFGGDGADKLYGNDGNDSILGNNGNDTIFGQAGDDKLYGNAGNDSMFGGEGNDIIKGQAGNDYLYGNAGNDSIFGGEGNDIIKGQTGNDYIQGNDGNDSIFGGDGVDKLYGNDGKDTLWGNAGNDSLWGGAGNDKFIYKANEGNDTIYDYESGELLQILNVNGGTGTFSTSTFSNNTLTLAVTGGGRVIFKNITTSTEFNINGTNYGISSSKLVTK